MVANRFPPWSAGGFETTAAAAIRWLHAAGHQVRVLTTVPDPSDLPGAVEPGLDVHRQLLWYWHNHEFPPIGLRATAALERENARVLARHLREFDPDAVLWWSVGGMSLSLLAQVSRAGVPAVGSVGDDWMSYGPVVDAWTRRWRGWRAAGAPIARWLTGVPATVDLAHAARWIFISEYLVSRARTAGVSQPDWVVAHPGIDPDLFVRAPSEPWRWRLLYCGRIDPRKGIATAIEALAQLPAEAALTVDGNGDAKHRSELCSLAARLGLAERVRFQSSSRKDLPAAYAAADAVLFPVKWEEPWGLVPLEAMAVGRPVIASRAGGGAAEYLRDGYNCLQFPPGDAAALASMLRRLEADPELRAELVEGGFETAARFTDQSFHETIERELQQVARTGRP